MKRVLSILCLVTAIGLTGLFSASADDQKKPAKAEIKGGLEGKVKSVDPDKETVTVTVEGKDRTFTITDDTQIVGPRGGIVRKRLKDPRFHSGLAITVVASGSTAKELHLGYDRKGTSSADKTKPGKNDDEDTDFLGKVKSFDASKRLLVVTLPDGGVRSFLLASSVKVTVSGTASKQGLKDPALKQGAKVEVLTEEGGRKVKEVKLTPSVVKKAG